MDIKELFRVMLICCATFGFSLNVNAKISGFSKIHGDSILIPELSKHLNKYKDGTSKLNYALELFKNTDSQSDQNYIAGLLDVFKLYGKSSHPVIEQVSLKLMENDPIYNGRGPKEVERLRGYMLASISEIGINEKIESIVIAELSFGYHPYLAAAAARSAGLINNVKLIPLLNKYLSQSYKDDYVDLDNYELNWPLKHPTSVRREVIKSLAKIGSVNSDLAIKGLNEITDINKKYFLSLDSNLNKEAVLAKNVILSKLNYPKFSLPESSINPHTCCSAESKTASAYWISSDKRKLQINNIQAKDQNGNDFKFSNTIGKPFAMTFFYTRCDNPEKCSSTIENLAKLQKDIKSEGLENKIELYGVTLEPTYDVPVQISVYGKSRGIDFEGNSKFLTMDTKVHDELIHELGVLVNYGKGLVNNHGTQLYLFDKKGRVAKVYDNSVWEDNSIIEDFNVLLKEIQ
ncbi:SCO family protein [Daejeonella oryzae]|uniref:SCO family protein n=1 Tax=Daejeonella oryzae TaxID=1122943 RepID=UPI0004147D34|nr:SCO family protein [Daejeonella oryzae]